MFTTIRNLARRRDQPHRQYASQYLYGNAGSNFSTAARGGDVMVVFGATTFISSRNITDRAVRSSCGRL